MWILTTIILAIMEISLLAKSYLIRDEHFRSSSIRTTENYKLLDHSFRQQRSHDILDCAHACLSDDRCFSFNFNYGGDGDCYLNERNASGMEEMLLFQQGYTYGELQNISVSILLGGRPKGNATHL